MATMTRLRQVRAGVLDVGYHESGPADGPPVVLMHGFPYDIHAYAEVAPLLAAKGCRVIVPYMRGYGSTRFLDGATPRSGQQGAFGADLLALLDALAIPRAVLAGYDWGGRACCIVAAVWPERCAGLVSLNSFNIQDIAAAAKPLAPENERRYWYQYYFHGERGRAGLEQDRRALCRLLWSLWSPTWTFDDATFERSAAAFDHPDFVEVVIHSYRHRFGLVTGDPAYDDIERRLAALPPVTVPAITFDGADDGVMMIGGTAAHARHFTGPHQHRVVPGAGHNLPQEKPQDFARAVLDLATSSRP
ncbi:alpha/beta fold hydrolase [Variovorax sp. WS11]|uniref:alpha/beta fold hydrolase n=2 Tax=Variovorax sp. WS11 TaxID=1105204 RepID=UPI00268D3407